MNDTVLQIARGTRLRVKGQSYEATESTSLPANLAPVKQQKNRHVKFCCPDPACAAAGLAKGFGDDTGRWSVRAARSIVLDAAPICGRCGSSVCVPDGDTVEALPE